MKHWRTHAVEILDAVVERRMEVPDFCTEFEQLWNFERNEANLTSDEVVEFQRLLEAVAWFSPYRDERLKYPGFTDESSILATAREVRTALRGS